MPVNHLERFALEQIDSDFCIVVMLEASQGRATACTYFDDCSVQEVIFLKDAATSRSNFEALAWHVDLFWGSKNSGKRCWLDCPIHVKLAQRLAEIVPESSIPSIVKTAS